MNKILKLFIFFLFIITLQNCDYKPVLSNKNINFSIINIGGADNDVTRSIKSNLKMYTNKTGYKNNYELIINLEKNKITKSRNSKGEPITLSLVIDGEILILENNKILNKIKINKFFNFKNTSNKFNLDEYENNIFNNLILKINDELIVKLIDLSND